MILEEKQTAYQFGREVHDLSEEDAKDFAEFAVGFHPSFTLEDRYISWQMARFGPPQTSLADQSKEYE